MKSSDQEVYKLYQGEKDGVPWFLILTEGYLQKKYSTSLPWFMRLSIDFTPSENGSISEQESRVLDGVEDGLKEKIRVADEAYFAGRFTHNGKRDLFFYLNDPKKVSVMLEQVVQEDSQTREFEYRIEKDSDWAKVKEILKIPDIE